ncbi:Golgin subfamily A member 1 [Nymphon striatum]|nr:Golgin subfamily A member 1 [Nymphon striatum]
MFAKLKKRIEEETEAELSTSVQLPGAFPDIHHRPLSVASSSSCESIPSIHKKSSQQKAVNLNIHLNGKKTFHVGRSSSKEELVTSKLNEQPSPKLVDKRNHGNWEHKEELQDFQKQEIAKVKHLLLSSENRLKLYKEQLEVRDKKLSQLETFSTQQTSHNDQIKSEVTEKSKMILQLESVIEKLSESNSQMINQLEENDRKMKKLIETEEFYLKLKNEQNSKIVNETMLAEEKLLLVLEIDNLKKKNSEYCDRISFLESTLTDRLDEFEALKHTHDIYRVKTSSILEEKDNLISNLEERSKVLEKRLNGNNLCGDEKLQSVISERNDLERKLEESRINLSEFKMVCSEKIYNLETQISHLNKKMGEDNEENKKLEDNCSRLQNECLKLQNECKTMASDLSLFQEQNRILNSAKEEFNVVKINFDQCDLERNRLINENIKLNDDILKFKNEIENLKDQIKTEKIERKNKIDELMGQQSEQLEKEIENENQISQYEALIKTLKSDNSGHEKECSRLKEKISIIQNKLLTTEKEHMSLKEKLHENHKKLEESQNTIEPLEIELDNVQQEKDTLLMRNSELSQQSELLKRELNEENMYKEKIQIELQENTSALQKQIKDMKIQMHTLECSANSNIENSERVAKLKICVVDLESQLAEKNKVIKLQQQRLSDIKKTLQKELKVQQQTSDSSSVGDGLDISLLGINRGSKSVPKTSNFSGFNSIGSQDFSSNDGVNIQYLRHVVFKFMTSREYEAQQLIKAVSVLLKFTAEQENIIKETLDWKMSWFGHKPDVNKTVVT